MSGKQLCSSCKKNIDMSDFIIDDKTFKTCIACRNRKSEKRRKNYCEECGIRASFNFEKQKFGIRCSLHKQIGMVDVNHKMCEHEGCKKRPNYNFEGEIKARFCIDHKLVEMINVKSNTCEQKGCIKLPSYNFIFETKALFCLEHKQIGMVNVNHKICEHEGCRKRPSYNIETDKKVRFCFEHKEIGMINVISKTCEHEGCSKRPIYNIEDETNARFCIEHKEIGMVDVKHKTCEQDDCQTRSNFGYINQTATHCVRHKLPLMFKKRKVECQEENCSEISEYGVEEPTHCFLHQKENELCLLGQTCKNCNRENELCNKEQICLTYCRPTELSITANKIIKKKEALVLSYLDKNIKTDINPIDDRIIDISCVKRRPDRVYDSGSYFLVVEIDENQHKSYSNGCSFDVKTQEYRRMVQIHEALSNGMMPVIFLRFNPDNFRVKGILQKVNMQKRLDILSKWVTHCLNLKEEPGQPSIRIKHLFYDDYEESNTKFETIEDMKSLI